MKHTVKKLSLSLVALIVSVLGMVVYPSVASAATLRSSVSHARTQINIVSISRSQTYTLTVGMNANCASLPPVELKNFQAHGYCVPGKVSPLASSSESGNCGTATLTVNVIAPNQLVLKINTTAYWWLFVPMNGINYAGSIWGPIVSGFGRSFKVFPTFSITDSYTLYPYPNGSYVFSLYLDNTTFVDGSTCYLGYPLNVNLTV